MIPAVGLIVVAAFGLVQVVAGVVQFATLDAQFDEQVNQINNNPQIPANQKKQQVDLMNKIRDYAKTWLLPLYGATAVASLITLIGGIKLMSLGSPGLVKFGALLSMLPCSGCCVLGLIFGIWAFVVLGKPEVKAGYAARNRSRFDSRS